METMLKFSVFLACFLEVCLALSCYDCSGDPEFCQKKVTIGAIYSQQQQEAARCMIVFGDGQLHKRRLSNIGDCTNPTIKQIYKNEGSFSNVNLHCCSEDNCNLDWNMAGGGVTEAPGKTGQSGTAASNENGGNGTATTSHPSFALLGSILMRLL